MKICLICARKGSVGVSRKHLLTYKNKTLIENTFDQALTSEEFDYIIFSSNDEVLLEISSNYKGIFSVKRSEILSMSSSSKWEAFRDAISQFSQERKVTVGPDTVICDLDISVPLREVNDIIGLLGNYKQNTVLITAYESERNPYFNMVEKKGKNYGIVKDLDTSIQNRQEAKQVYSLSSSIFCFSYMLLLKLSHWSEGEIDIYPIPRKRGFDLDTMDDYEYFKLIRDE
ncbi:hypothetical protein OAG38_02910 [Akkermansiaceae bacterium]|nr:hypothetical protein [Akkermansiaceae bacterium]